MMRSPLLSAFVFCAALFAAPLAWAQYNAFKDPAAPSASPGGKDMNDFRAMSDTIQGGKVAIGGTSYVVALFKNQAAGSVKPAQANIYPSSGVNAEMVLDQCSGASLAVDGQCAITIGITGRQQGMYRVEILVPHDGRSGISTVAITGEVEQSAITSATVYPVPMPDKGLLVSDREVVDFGAGVKEQAAITISLVNSGKFDVTLTGIRLAAGSNGLSVGASGCARDMVLKPGDACPLTVNWLPARQGGVIDSLQINHTGARGILVIPVKGVADKASSSGAVFDSFPAGGTGDANDFLKTITAKPQSASKKQGAADEKIPALRGYTITSHSASRAVINGPAGAMVVRDGEYANVAGAKWRVTVTPTGVLMASGKYEADLSFDPSLKAIRKETDDSSASMASASAPATSAMPTPSSLPPALSDLQRIIP